MLKYFFLPALALIVFSSCSKEAVLRKYYVLHPVEMKSGAKISPDSVLHLKPLLPVSAEIIPFTASRAFSQSKIALRTRSNEINYYFYHLWAEKPETAIRFYLWNTLNEQKIFKRCELSAFKETPDVLISGVIREIERVERNRDHAAHLNMVFQVFSYQDNQLLLEHSFDRFMTLREDAPMNDFAVAVARMIDEEILLFIQKLNTDL